MWGVVWCGLFLCCVWWLVFVVCGVLLCNGWVTVSGLVLTLGLVWLVLVLSSHTD